MITYSVVTILSHTISMVQMNTKTILINISLYILFTLNCFECIAQRIYHPKSMKYSSLSFGLGTSHFYGDVGSLTNLKSVRWNINCSYTYTLNNKINLGVSASYIRLSGDDFYSNNDADFIRNLHFRNDIKQLSTFIEYHPLNHTSDFRKRINISPYLLSGIGYYFHNPQAKLPLDLGNKWVDLEPIHTEGQGINPIYPEPYKLSGISIPLGFGLQYKYSKHFNLVVEVVHYTPFSDYIDDVSGVYPNRILFNNEFGSVLSNRSGEQFAADTGNNRSDRVTKYLEYNGVLSAFPFNELGAFVGTTGSNRGSKIGNDNFFVTTFKIQYLIPHLKIRCPKIN